MAFFSFNSSEIAEKAVVCSKGTFHLRRLNMVKLTFIPVAFAFDLKLMACVIAFKTDYSINAFILWRSCVVFIAISIFTFIQMVSMTFF